MKLRKLLVCSLAIAMLFGMTLTTNAAYGRSYEAPKGTPEIDAEVDEVWKTAPWTSVDKVWDGSVDTDSKLRIKLVWDETYLYFLADVYDTAENKRNDIVEIYLDQKNDKTAIYGDDDTHTRFYVKGGVVQGDAKLAGTNAQLDAPSAAKSLGNDKFIVEGAIKWPAGKPAIGDEMGLEFMYNDGTLYQAFMEAYRWNVDTTNGDEPPYASTEYFGTLILKDVGTPLPDNASIDETTNTNEPAKDTEHDKDVSSKNGAETTGDTNAESESTKKADTTLLIVIGGASAITVLIVIVAILSNKKKSKTD